MTTRAARDNGLAMDPLARQFDRYRRHGDLAALGEVFDGTAARLLTVAQHLCGHLADAEDAVQQTFLLAMDRAAAFDASLPFEPWLAGLLRNVVRNQTRRAGRRRVEPLPECTSDDAGPMASAERDELVARLHAQVDALPADQRQVLRLQLQHGLSPAAIAQVLELPPGAVRMRLHRGLEALRRLLPAGLLAALIGGLPARGLAAMKQAVLAAGEAQVAAGVVGTAGVVAAAGGVGSVAMVGGAFAMKKLAALLAVVVGVGVLWWFGALPPLDSPRDPVVAPTPAAVPVAAVLPSGPAPDDGAGAAREAVPVAVAAPAAASAEPTPTELWGVVVDADTKAPIAGADVQLRHCENDEFWSLDLVRGERIATLGRATSDSEGHFRFDVVRARPHRLHVAAAGYAPTNVHGRSGGSVVVIDLTRGASVSGVVKCKDQPLAGVEVRLAVRGESIELARGRTDAGGAFHFTGLPPASTYVQVRSPRFEEEWQQLVIEAGKEHHVTIEMDVGKSLRGRVLDAATSLPIAEAEVTDSWVFRRVVRTDTDGRFELAGLRDEGHSTAHIRAPGYATATVNVGGKLADELVVKLQRGGEVVGRVVDSAGSGLGDAYVAVCASYWKSAGSQGSDWIAAVVSADGRFQALGLRPDQHYWLLVRRNGCGARVYGLPRVLAGGERHDVGEVVLQPGAGVEGRVLDDAEQPLAGVEVDVRGTNADSRKWLAPGAKPTEVSQFESRSVTTDARGVFRIADLAAGTFKLTARLERRAGEATHEVTTVDGTLHDGITLVLPRGKTITGTLLLPGGVPPGDGQAVWLEATGRNHESHQGVVQRDGAFRIEGLPDGEYTLTVMDAPKGFALSPVKGVKAGTDGVPLVFEASSFVAGRVVDADGKPKKARVYAQLTDGGSRLHATDDQGAFRIEVPASFRGTIGAMAMDDQMVQAQVQDVAAGRTDVEITVLRLGTRGGGR